MARLTPSVVQLPVLSRIRIRDKKKIRIQDEHLGSYFRALGNNFLGKNTLILICRSGYRIRELFDPGSRIKMEKLGSGINTRIRNTNF
jgi:hypothetical protein